MHAEGDTGAKTRREIPSNRRNTQKKGKKERENKATEQCLCVLRLPPSPPSLGLYILSEWDSGWSTPRDMFALLRPSHPMSYASTEWHGRRKEGRKGGRAGQGWMDGDVPPRTPRAARTARAIRQYLCGRGEGTTCGVRCCARRRPCPKTAV